ncbi:MAG TPA: FUSC family protein [Vicinamibacteria bacterium]
MVETRHKPEARPLLLHSARTAMAAVLSLTIAHAFVLPEWYWAPITTLAIEQSSWGSALAISWHRFMGTLVGAAVGAMVAGHSIPGALAFGGGLFILGLLRPLTRFDLNGYRFGGVTLAIVLLVPRAGPAWQIALHRFAEVSIGIAVALMLALVWPERHAAFGARAATGAPHPNEG